MGQRASSASSNGERYMEEVLMGILWRDAQNSLPPDINALPVPWHSSGLWNCPSRSKYVGRHPALGTQPMQKLLALMPSGLLWSAECDHAGPAASEILGERG